jgi:hypothetical protein
VITSIVTAEKMSDRCCARRTSSCFSSASAAARVSMMSDSVCAVAVTPCRGSSGRARPAFDVRADRLQGGGGALRVKLRGGADRLGLPPVGGKPAHVVGKLILRVVEDCEGAGVARDDEAPPRSLRFENGGLDG